MIGFIVLMLGLAQAGLAVASQAIEGFVFGLILLLSGYYLWQIDRNTPYQTFLKSARAKVPVLEIERRDGNIEFESPEYSAGSAISKKYGVFGVNPEGVKTEMKSRIKILHCIEGIGQTLSRKHVMIINALKKQYGVTDYRDIVNLASSWRRCDNKDCKITDGYEGIFEPIKEQRHNEDGTVNEIRYYRCPMCHKKDGLPLEPPIKLPNQVNVEAGYIDKYFMENQNPILNSINAKKLAMNELEKEKGIPIGKIAIFASLGMMFFLILLGVYIVTSNLDLSGAPQIPGLTLGG